jgi:membrane protein implicated in regulation of membrane protease activity
LSFTGVIRILIILVFIIDFGPTFVTALAAVHQLIFFVASLLLLLILVRYFSQQRKPRCSLELMNE